MSDFDSLFRQHPIPSWVYSERTLRFLAVNEAAVRQYGFSQQQFLAMTIEQIRPPQDVERLHNHIAGDEHSRIAPSTWRHLRSDGTCIEVEIESSPITYGGEPARLVAARNVSGHSNNMDKLYLALHAGKLAIWECNLADRSIVWDPLNSGLYGIDRSLFPKNHPEFLALVEPEYREMLQVAFERCIAQGESYDCKFQINMPGLGLRWRHAIGRLIRDHAGTPVKVMGIGIDITERKLLEDELHRSQKLEAVGRLASGIAHDFNNMLTVIYGYSQLLRIDRATDLIDKAASEICVAVDRSSRLVRQLLDYSRTRPVSPKPVDLSSVVTETLSLLRRLLPETIRMSVDVPDAPTIVCADPGQIEQLIMNLCLNARDAMPQGGDLRCQVHAAAPAATIIVSDTGTGIAREISDRMFEPFFTTKAVGKGDGLGLSIVYGVVNQLGGKIDVHSVVGEGSTFTIQLPLVDCQHKQKTASEPTPDCADGRS